MEDGEMRPADPPTYPRYGTFRKLLNWHLNWGTKPGCSRTKKNAKWTRAIFATLVHEEGLAPESAKRSLRNWTNADKLPEQNDEDKLARIYWEFFGKDPKLAHWKKDLEGALQSDRQAKPKGGTPTAKAFNHSQVLEPTRVPLPTTQFVGRADEVEQLASALATGTSSAILLQGGPGIGKTELAKAVAQHSSVAERFGNRRWFVALETSTTAEAMRKAILRATEIEPASSFQTVQDRLVVLDNLETPWEPAGQRSETEAVLGQLAQAPGLSLLASFRGLDWVGGPAWSCHFVDPLAPNEAKDLFAKIAGPRTRSDPRLADFLKALGGVPLAITLVARRAHGCKTLEDLWEEWERIGVRFAVDPNSEASPITSLFKSVELSLLSSRLDKSSIRLFRLLGVLPYGFRRKDVRAILGSGSFRAIECLINAGIALEREDRIDLLPPVREHAFRDYYPNHNDLVALTAHFTQIAVSSNEYGEGNDPSIRQKFLDRWVEEIDNIEYLFHVYFRQDRAIGLLDNKEYLSHLDGFKPIKTSKFYQYLAMHSDEFFKFTRENGVFREGTECMAVTKAEAYLFSSEFAFSQNDLTYTKLYLEQALSYARQVDDLGCQGVCLYNLGDVAILRADYEDARRCYFESRLLLMKAGYTVTETETENDLAGSFVVVSSPRTDDYPS